MPDLTDRALDTATARGAAYADVRVVRRLEESITDQDRPGRGRRLGRERGLRRPRPGRRRVGLRLVARPDRRRGRPRRRRGRPDRPGQRHRPARPDPARRPAAGPRHLRDAGRGGPVRGPARDQDRATCSPPTRPRAGSRASPSPSRCYAAQREWKTFAATDGSLTEQAITHVGAAVEANAVDGDEHQRRSYPDSGGGWGRRRLRDRPAPPAWPSGPSRSPRRRSRC